MLFFGSGGWRPLLYLTLFLYSVGQGNAIFINTKSGKSQEFWKLMLVAVMQGRSSELLNSQNF